MEVHHEPGCNGQHGRRQACPVAPLLPNVPCQRCGAPNTFDALVCRRCSGSFAPSASAGSGIASPEWTQLRRHSLPPKQACLAVIIEAVPVVAIVAGLAFWIPVVWAVGARDIAPNAVGVMVAASVALLLVLPANGIGWIVAGYSRFGAVMLAVRAVTVMILVLAALATAFDGGGACGSAKHCHSSDGVGLFLFLLTVCGLWSLLSSAALASFTRPPSGSGEMPSSGGTTYETARDLPSPLRILTGVTVETLSGFAGVLLLGTSAIHVPRALANSWFYADGHLTLWIVMLLLASGSGWIIAGRKIVGLALMACRWALLMTAFTVNFFSANCFTESCPPGYTAFAGVALVFLILVAVAMPLGVALSVARIAGSPARTAHL